MKRVGIVLGILLVLVLVLAAVAPFLVDLNDYKGKILEEIKPYVPREVDFEHVELTVLSGLGVEIRGLRIADNPAFSKGDFLALDSLQVRVRILPLLRGRIKVKKIVLDRPVIHLARNAEGTFSFDDLLGTQEEGPAGKGGQPAEGEPAAKESGGGLGLLAGLLVNDLAIKQGRIVYRDEMLWPGRKPLVIGALDLGVRDLSLDQPVSIRLAASLLDEPEQNVEIEGTVGPFGEEIRPEKVPFDLRASLSRLPLGGVVSLLPSELPVQIRSGDGSLHWAAKGSLDRQIVSQSEINLQELQLAAAGGTEAGNSKPPLLNCSLKQKLVLEFEAERLQVESTDLAVNGEHLQMEGTLTSFRSRPRWEGKVWSDGLRPEVLVALVPAAAQAVPGELRFQGPVAVRLESEGDVDEFTLDTRLDMAGMKIEFGDLLHKPSGGKFSIGWKADKKGERVTLKDLELVLHTLTLNASGEMMLSETPHFGFLVQTNPVALQGWDVLCPLIAPYRPDGSVLVRSSLRGTTDDASVNLQVSSDKIGFVLPPSEGDKAAGADRSGVLESCNIKVQAKKRPAGVLGDAQAEVKKGRLLSVPFERLLTRVKYSPEVVEIEGLEMNVFQGEVQATGRYDPSEGTWSLRPNVKDVAMGEVLDRLTEYKDVFSGSFRGRFTASGNSRAGAEKDVSAEGTFRVSQGELKNFDLVGSVMDGLFGLKGIEQKLESSRSEIQKHESTRFDWLEGNFRMREGMLQLEGLQLRNVGTSKATDSDALLQGDVDLERQQIDMKGRVILSKRHSAELAAGAEVLKALYNPEQRIVLPLTLKGRVTRPVAFLDTEYVMGALSRYYTRQGVEKLRDQLGLPGEDQDGGESPADLLLKQLFKKR